MVIFFEHVGWSALFWAAQLGAAVLMVCMYMAFMPRSARNALLLAIPVPFRPRPVRPVRQQRDVLLREDGSLEQLEGRIDLECFTVAHIEPNPLVRRNVWVRGLKRVTDVATSVALILFTLPLLLVVALAIKLTSRGPVFYRQTRVGRYGKPFKIIKFRSMTVDAEANGVQWAGQNDQRITAVGRFIRATRIDEIPQAINIFLGHMSFVGPRPERPEFTSLLADEIPHYDLRHRVKPGLTGWAQVNYPYGASVEDAAEKLRYDLYYMKNHSLLLDWLIIVRTVSVAINGTGSR